MSKYIENFADGLRSILVIMPAGTVSKIPLNQKTDAENLRDDWQKVGDNMRYAMNQVDNEQKQ